MGNRNIFKFTTVISQRPYPLGSIFRICARTSWLILTAISSADCSGYDPTIGQRDDHCLVIRITGRVSYGSSILNMFNTLLAIELLGDGRQLLKDNLVGMTLKGHLLVPIVRDGNGLIGCSTLYIPPFPLSTNLMVHPES